MPLHPLAGHHQARRRLADSITDARAAAILRQMADEGDADIARLEAQAAESAANLPQSE